MREAICIRREALRNAIRNVGGMTAPDAELAEALQAMKVVEPGPVVG